MDDGNTQFTPAEGGPAVSGAIVDGQYKFTAQTGVPAGNYQVKIIHFPLKDKNFKGRKSDAPTLPDTRFTNPMPKGGWVEEVEVTQEMNGPLDFDVE